MNGIHEAVGSIPISSTKDYKGLTAGVNSFFVSGAGNSTFIDIRGQMVEENGISRDRTGHGGIQYFGSETKLDDNSPLYPLHLSLRNFSSLIH